MTTAHIFRAAVPHGLTLLRALAAPALFVLTAHGADGHAAALLLGAAATDLADGPSARRLAVASRAGGYADASADFLVVGAAFAGFVVRGLYPPWVLAIIGLMFAQFIATSLVAARRRRHGLTDHPVYDPVGRYYGAFLYAAALATVAATAAARTTVPGALLAVTIASCASRAAWLARPPRSADRVGSKPRARPQ